MSPLSGIAPAVFVKHKSRERQILCRNTKSIFNATPKINYTVSDISRNQCNASTDKPTVALKYLPSLTSKCFANDLLFTDDKKNAVVNVTKDQ